MKKYYCKEKNCNNKICYKTWKYGQGRCHSCSAKYKHKIGILNAKGKYNGRYIDGRTNRKCIECNNKVSYLYGKRCKSCADRQHSRRMIGKNNPNWKDGKSSELYPLGWNKTFKEQIRYRDSYKCQECGCHEIECRRKLDVHHIDYNKENINPKNLISLCQSCHVKTNYNREYWFKYFTKTYTIMEINNV